jgi:hypothetical protein
LCHICVIRIFFLYLSILKIIFRQMIQHTYIHTYTNTNTHIHLRTYLHAYILTYMHTLIRTYIHILVHTHTYIYTYIHTCIRTYTHTYIHTFCRCISVSQRQQNVQYPINTQIYAIFTVKNTINVLQNNVMVV